MRPLFYSFAFLFLSYLPSFSQTQVASSKKVLVASGTIKQGNFELHRFEGDGERNTSSASGPGFVSTGGTLSEIFTELWPEVEFKISRKFGEELYTLRINTSADLDQSVLDQIWKQLDQRPEFVTSQTSQNQKGNCLQISSQDQLDKSLYTPKNGVLKKNESSKSRIILEGYTVEELAEKLSQEKRLGRFFFEQAKSAKVYSFSLDASSLDSLREGLKSYGVILQSCNRTVYMYEMK
ncbi:hypothetical protein Aoki45_29890 [Algoriphagus sp. oki45]|uniref:hypothetical protein n=1 Tax=Algoriphagus sp. oki45 TaxID=3067294 RepID=UPI0027E76582|nr:hypothetical protein Aoki45_29890 [Algoriphagus sp. oki45]